MTFAKSLAAMAAAMGIRFPSLPKGPTKKVYASDPSPERNARLRAQHKIWNAKVENDKLARLQARAARRAGGAK